MVAPTFLQINLTDSAFEVKSYDELVPRVGGLGWALSLFERFAEEDPIVFATGPLSAVFPGASKTVAVFRSPQTGGLATSFAGGNLARFLRFAGYQGLVIYGRASYLTLVEAEEDKVTFSDARPYSGLETPKAFELVFSSFGVPGRRSVMLTGPAAERGLGYSPLYVDEFFSFPRAGLGRAFALKNLKVLTIAGERSEDLPDARRYQEVFDLLRKKLQGYQELSKLGTLRNLAAEKSLSAVAANNFTESGLTGEELLAPKFFQVLSAHRVSCGGCPVGCIHLLHREKRFTYYDYEGVAALGPLLGIFEAASVAQLLERVWALGMDPTSVGAILAYVTEKEGLSFGNAETYLTLLDALFAGREKWSQELQDALPSGRRSLSLGGLEFLPYFNGYASILSQVLQLGATTEENRGYLLDLELLDQEVGPEKLVQELVTAEKRKILGELLVGCGYLADVFEDSAVAFSATQALGEIFSHENLQSAAEEVFQDKLRLQHRLGFRPRNVKIPEKFFQIPSPQGILKRGKLEEMVTVYEENYYEPASRS
ncbi:MAG: aldehyde ferredoxin oxidoreductase N-terminal domain-containing protein [candidate division WWE3 bacterium]|nr:aldehyde ferredoxin oxidoreductase N-terminal domain-containing protein [candidate division WWE3 bacterium]